MASDIWNGSMGKTSEGKNPSVDFRISDPQFLWVSKVMTKVDINARLKPSISKSGPQVSATYPGPHP